MCRREAPLQEGGGASRCQQQLPVARPLLAPLPLLRPLPLPVVGSQHPPCHVCTCNKTRPTQVLFYSRIFADILGRLAPRRKALMLRAQGAMLALAGGMVALAGMFFVYIQVRLVPVTALAFMHL